LCRPWHALLLWGSRERVARWSIGTVRSIDLFAGRYRDGIPRHQQSWTHGSSALSTGVLELVAVGRCDGGGGEVRREDDQGTNNAYAVSRIALRAGDWGRTLIAAARPHPPFPFLHRRRQLPQAKAPTVPAAAAGLFLYPVAPCSGGRPWWWRCGSGIMVDGGGALSPGDVVVGLPCSGDAGGR
jgi:hypothetical protein